MHVCMCTYMCTQSCMGKRKGEGRKRERERDIYERKQTFQENIKQNENPEGKFSPKTITFLLILTNAIQECYLKGNYNI